MAVIFFDDVGDDDDDDERDDSYINNDERGRVARQGKILLKCITVPILESMHRPA
jgi:hypothetical protein